MESLSWSQHLEEQITQHQKNLQSAKKRILSERIRTRRATINKHHPSPHISTETPFKKIWLYRITLLDPNGNPPLFYFGIHRSKFDNPHHDDYMGSSTLKDLWSSRGYTIQRDILRSEPYSLEMYRKLLTNESLIIREARRKYPDTCLNKTCSPRSLS